MAKPWRAASSIKTLQRQINEAFPKRSKISDGTIGDTAHSARTSDHNPNSANVVTATDITHDPKTGVDCHKLAASLQKSGDKRIKYIIWNGQITQKTDITKWKKYTGKNPHKRHLHISVASDAKLYDDGRDWNLTYLKPKAKTFVSTDTPETRVSPDTASIPPDSVEPPAPQAAEAENIATEQTVSAEQQTDAGTIKSEVTTKNEQSVNETVEIAQPEPQGVGAKLKAGIGTLFGGTIVYTLAEKFGAMTFSQQSIILISVVCLFALLGFMFWAWIDAWKQAQKIRVEAEINADITKKNIKWV